MKRSGPRAKEFRWYEGLAVCLAYIGIQLGSEVVTSWGFTFYSAAGSGRTVFVAVGLVWIIFAFGRLFDAITDPLIGMWSDATRTDRGRWRLVPLHGRRMPFLFWGSLLMTATGVLFWFPPVEGTSSANLVYGTLILSLHWGFFTLCQIPLDALTPELARSKAGRIAMGQWRAAGLIVGIAIAAIAPGVLIGRLDPAAAAGGETTVVGYQRMGIVLSIAALLLFQMAIWTIRERRGAEGRAPAANLPLAEVRDAARNTVCWHYFAILALFNLGYLAVQKAIPQWVEIGVGGNEETVSILMLPFIGSCLVSALVLTPILARFMALKWMLFLSLAIIGGSLPFMYVIGVSPADTDTKIVWGMILYGVSGVGQGLQYALLTPLIGEIIDLDERRSGVRREAIYTGFFGASWKASQALSVVVLSVLLAVFGNTRDEPMGIMLVGPVAGLFALLALGLTWSYPVLDVTPRTAPADSTPPSSGT